MNEEKEDIYFVWEKTTRGGMVVYYQPSVYRGLPKTGVGTHADNAKFLHKEKITEEEAKEPMITLINRYPCPPKPEN